MVSEKNTAVNDGFEVVDDQTGEIKRFHWQEGRGGERVAVEAFDQDAADLERWILQSAARRLLHGVEYRERRVRVPFSEFAYFTDVSTRCVRTVLVRERCYVEVDYLDRSDKVQGLATALKRVQKFRVLDCCRVKIGADAPEIWYSPKSNRASFHKVGVCGSVHTCPICARRVQVARQEQIKAAYSLVTEKASGDAIMITLTVPHGLGDDLAVLFDALKTADRRYMQKHYDFKKLVGYRRTVAGVSRSVPSEYGYIGRVSASEITYGKANGWHPHLHQLWFFDRKLTDREIVVLRRRIYKAWSAAAVAVGLPMPKEVDRMGKPVGVDARRALTAADYLTKFGRERECRWTVEKEMANQSTKVAKGKGRSAFQLLADYAQGDKQAGALFHVYAEATLGRHQLEFSKSLKSYLVGLGLDEVLKGDEELAAETGEEARLIGALTDEDFQALKGAERYGIEAFGLVLNMAKNQGFDAAISWLRSLPSYQGVIASGDAVARKVSRVQADFWTYVNLLDDAAQSADLEDSAAALVYEVNVSAALAEWSRLLAELKRRRFSSARLLPSMA